MLLRERMQALKLSPAERQIVDTILQLEEKLEDYSSIQLAKETFSSAPAIVRLCKKLGFQGWNEFKKAYLKEYRYLTGAFQDVDPNFPFAKGDSSARIFHSIASVYQESIRDTVSLLNMEQVDEAVDLMVRSRRIVLFGISNLSYVLSEFAFLMERIGANIHHVENSERMSYTAFHMKSDECAILLSYSGETLRLLNVLSLLEERNVPVIAITGIGGNALSTRAHISLPVSTREKIYSKIGGFASITSMRLVLDTLYCCYYARNYEANTEYKLSASRRIEHDRKAKNTIVAED